MPANFSDDSRARGVAASAATREQQALPWCELEVDWPVQELSCDLEVVAPRPLTALEWVIERILDEFPQDPPTLEEAADELGMKDARFLRDTFDSLFTLGALQAIDAQKPRELSNTRLTERGQELFRKGRIDASPAHYTSHFLLDPFTETHWVERAQAPSDSSQKSAPRGAAQGSDSTSTRSGRTRSGETGVQSEIGAVPDGTAAGASKKGEGLREHPKNPLVSKDVLPPPRDSIGLDRARALSVALGEPHHRGESAIRAVTIKQCRPRWKPVPLSLVFRKDGTLQVSSTRLKPEQLEWLGQVDLDVLAIQRFAFVGGGIVRTSIGKVRPLNAIPELHVEDAPIFSDQDISSSLCVWEGIFGFAGVAEQELSSRSATSFTAWQADHPELLAPELVARRTIDLIRGARSWVVMSAGWHRLDGVERALNAAMEQGVACVIVSGESQASLLRFHDRPGGAPGFILRVPNMALPAPALVLLVDGTQGLEVSNVEARTPGGRSLILQIAATMTPPHVQSTQAALLATSSLELKHWVGSAPPLLETGQTGAFRMRYASYVVTGQSSYWSELVKLAQAEPQAELRVSLLRTWAGAFSRAKPLVSRDLASAMPDWWEPAQQAWQRAFDQWRMAAVPELTALTRLLALANDGLKPQAIDEEVYRVVVRPAPVTQDKAPLERLKAVIELFRTRWPKPVLDERKKVYLPLLEACLVCPPIPRPESPSKEVVMLVKQVADPPMARAWAEAQSRLLERPSTVDGLTGWFRWHAPLQELLEPELSRRMLELWLELCAEVSAPSIEVLKSQLQVLKDTLGKSVSLPELLKRRLQLLESPDASREDVWEQLGTQVSAVLHLREGAQQIWPEQTKQIQSAIWEEALNRMLVVPAQALRASHQARVAGILGALTAFPGPRARWAKSLSANIPIPRGLSSFIEWLELHLCFGQFLPERFRSDAAEHLARLGNEIRLARQAEKGLVEHLMDAWKRLRLPPSLLEVVLPTPLGHPPESAGGATNPAGQNGGVKKGGAAGKGSSKEQNQSDTTAMGTALVQAGISAGSAVSTAKSSEPRNPAQITTGPNGSQTQSQDSKTQGQAGQSQKGQGPSNSQASTSKHKKKKGGRR